MTGPPPRQNRKGQHMTKRIRPGRSVNLWNGIDVVTLSSGQDVPQWADDRITNPEVFEVIDPDDDAPNPSGDERIGDGLDDLNKESLKKIAEELGVATSGTKEQLRANIRSKWSENAGTTIETPEGNGDENSREALEAKALELGIEFTADTTDAELEALISDKD